MVKKKLYIELVASMALRLGRPRSSATPIIVIFQTEAAVVATDIFFGNPGCSFHDDVVFEALTER